MALTINDVPPELVEGYIEGKFGFFVGAGLSLGAGLPDWNGLLIKLITRAENSHLIDAAKADDCRKLATDTTKYLMLAEEMKEVLGPTQFKTVIEDVFVGTRAKPSRAHELLVQLERMKFIITTNYDMLIEDAFVSHRTRPRVYKYYEAGAIQRALFKREFFVLKAHGDAETSAEQIILTERDYRRVLYREPGYQSTVQSIFTMYSVIFLGSSLNDPELRLLLNYINSAFPQGGIQHYALMSVTNIGQTEQGRWLKDYNIRIIPISDSKSYEDIDIFLSLLRDEEKNVAAKTPSP
jgi:hypothetical protein